jgi:tRNA A-37 threonylcarbamoyl transferase component Bud32
VGVNAPRQIAVQSLAREASAIRLTGHSGAQLMLLPRDGGYVVRKSSGSLAKNARLLAQADQQRQFFFLGIAVPRVLETGTDEHGHAYFEMEYVPGQTLANMVAEAMPLDWRPVEDALTRLFDFLRMTTSGTIPAAAFLDKIAAIAACDSAIFRHCAEPIARVAARLAAMDWSGIPHSAGHGDLTLENMLVSPGRGIVFIDCDVCFASSYWLDAGKLFQDIAGHWCLRKRYGSGGPALTNAIEQIQMLDAPLRALVARLDPALPERLAQLAAFHLFRTLPYIRETAIAAFVLGRLEAVLS